ncbi:MAG: TIGR01777 family oxidoreductase [Flavobacteriales bacterium]|nr:TIGR01777 family oxidoreductase [Flavobacteriales bacterium]
MKYKGNKKLVVAGGSGFLGNSIIERFRSVFEEIVVLTRKPQEAQHGIRWVRWDGVHVGKWVKEIDGADLLINLAGRSVNCRYHQKNKTEILQSRVKSTLALGAAVIAADHPPECWMNASSATIYDDEYNTAHTEAEGRIGHDFSMNVCKEWEATFNDIPVPGTRKLILRMGLVFGKAGGALPELVNLAKMGLGGNAGTGKQRMSWIHEDDLANALINAYEDDWEGVFNLTAPTHPTNEEVMGIVRELKNATFSFPIGKRLLEFGAWIRSTETELLLKSRYVYPQRLMEHGYEFKYPHYREALEALIRGGGMASSSMVGDPIPH